MAPGAQAQHRPSAKSRNHLVIRGETYWEFRQLLFPVNTGCRRQRCCLSSALGEKVFVNERNDRRLTPTFTHQVSTVIAVSCRHRLGSHRCQLSRPCPGRWKSGESWSERSHLSRLCEAGRQPATCREIRGIDGMLLVA